MVTWVGGRQRPLRTHALRPQTHHNTLVLHHLLDELLHLRERLDDHLLTHLRLCIVTVLAAFLLLREPPVEPSILALACRDLLLQRVQKILAVTHGLAVINIPSLALIPHGLKMLLEAGLGAVPRHDRLDEVLLAGTRLVGEQVLEPCNAPLRINVFTCAAWQRSGTP